ncbi:MAG: TIGR03086 family metal-binding protein [Actinomycetota bacterium]
MADLLRQALEHTGGVVRAVPADRLGAPTPCGDWTVARLVHHIVGGNLYFAASARGEQPDRALFSRDNVGNDADAAYRRSADEAIEAWSRPGVMEGALASGAPAQLLWNIHLVEVLGHGWDLAQAAGLPRDLPPGLAEAALEVARRLPPEQIRSEAVFGPEVAVGPETPPADRLAAFLGRTPPDAG